MSFQNSLIEFHRPENLEEEEILFFSSSSTKTQKFPNEVVLAAALYLCYVRSTLRGKYCQISEARSELVNALRTKYFFETETMIKISKINLGYETPPIKMMKSLANGRSPTDLGDEDSELSKVIKLKKSFVKFPQKLNFLSAPPKINPDLKYFVDEIPEFFPGLDTYKVYLAASMGLTDENFTEFAKFSMEDRIQFRDEINLILPGRAWTYWQDGIDELFNPHFKIPD